MLKSELSIPGLHEADGTNVVFLKIRSVYISLFDYSFLVRDEIELEHYIVNSLN